MIDDDEFRAAKWERKYFRTFAKKVQAATAEDDTKEARQDVEELAVILQHTASNSLRWRGVAVLGMVALSSSNKGAKRAAKRALKQWRFAS